MLIQEMTEEECRIALKQVSLARLACVRGNQPYIVPVYVAYDGQHLYGITTPGRKIEWMRSNPLVCLEFDERTSHHDWMSIIAFGRYEELTDASEYQPARARALEVLQKRTMWWEPACVPIERGERRQPVFYRIHVEHLTGRQASPEALEAADD